MTILGWMVYACSVSCLVAAGAWLLDRGLGRAGLPSRWVWMAALVVSVGLPVSTVAGLPTFTGRGKAPPTELLGQAEVIAPPPGSGSLLTDRIGPVSRLAALATGGVSEAIRRAAALAPSGPYARRWTVRLWLTVSTLLAMALLISRLLLALRARGWPTSRRGDRTFRISPRLGPAAVGLLRPEIVVPRWALSLPPSDLALILDHEEEHVRARDPLLLAFGMLSVLAAPWNPLLWWQVRRLRDAIEVDTDRRVLRRGIPARSYGRLLLDVEGRAHRDILPIPAMSGPPSLLERRLGAMKKRPRRRTIPQAVAAVAMTLGLVAVACETEPPTADDGAEAAAAPAIESTRVAADSSIWGLPSVTLADSPLVFVDGVEVANDDVLGDLHPADIASIEVVKGNAATSVWGERAHGGVIQITTKQGAEPAPEPQAEPQAEPEPEPEPRPATLAPPPYTPYDVAPEIRNRPAVQRALTEEYPPELRDAGIGGRALFYIHIDSEGVLDRVGLAESSGNDELDAAAVRVLGTFEFAPATLDGQPVAVWLQVPVTFESR